jgi:uncharacterized protein with NAD-binding domain and iron-sulfur cluster
MHVNAGRSVAVVGGGISGLSAAHELAKRGFSVTVYERRARVGGKASSWEEHELPAEHGFRFFPGFYFHVVETMKEIPDAEGSGSVADHLVELDSAVIADDGGKKMTTPLPTRERRPKLSQRIAGIRSFRQSLPGPWEFACFIATLARLANSCERRWTRQLENQSWLQHVMSAGRGHRRSLKYRRLFALGLTRTFVATRAEEMNARTGGMILLQLLYDTFFGPPIRRAADRALDGPTSDVWIQPWHAYLSSELGVEFELDCQAVGLDISDHQISGIKVRKGTPAEAPLTATAPSAEHTGFDWYVLAVPCEVLKELLVSSPALLKTDPQLAGVFNLETRWMNGIVLGVPAALDPPLPKGHVLCLDSPWALTLLDQTKVWNNRHLTNVRRHFQTLLSIDISDWDTPGRLGLPAKWPPTRERLVDDLWSQLEAHLPQLGPRPPGLRYNLDFDIQYDTITEGGDDIRIAQMRTNEEPLLINTPGSWSSRPRAKTGIRNLFVAGDFAQTHTNFASMEAANEAARCAVNELLKAARVDGECPIEPLQDPDVWWFRAPQRVARFVDKLIYRSPLPLRTPYRLPIAAWIVLGLSSKLASRTRTQRRLS